MIELVRALRVAAARYKAGLASWSDVDRAARDCLDGGLDSPAMIDLASWGVDDERLVAALREAGVRLSTDPQFIEKVVDVVGLYHHPPERAVVLCVDEKSQIQALNRSQPVLPMMPGMPERRTHDYHRNGITSLFAAFDIADGTVISELHRQHRAVEFKKFLITIDKAVAAELDIHLVCDIHKTPAIRAWLAKHPRFHMHFTPTGSSWINQVERWFGFLTDQKIRRGTHKSVQALEADIRSWIADGNSNPRPFLWTKTAEEILESLARFCMRTSGAAH